MNRAELDALIAERDDALRRLHLRDAECAHMRAERDAARAECDALREANERFGKRQAWWTRTMVESESNRECLQAECDALRALLAEVRGALMEVRAHMHAAGRRPETCHEMSVIDEVLMTLRSER